MAREKKEEKKSRREEREGKDGAEKRGFFRAFREETVEGILALLFILAAVFLALSPFHLAGTAGDLTFRGLDTLFGIGYYLAPVLLLVLGISYFRDLSRNLALPKAAGGILSFLAGLNLVEVFSRGQGGIIGGAMTNLMLKAFDTYFTVISMAVITAIGVAMLLDAPLSLLSFGWLRRKPADPAIDAPVKITSGGEPIAANETPTAAASPAAEEARQTVGAEDEQQESPPARKASGLVFFARRASAAAFTPPPLSLLDTDSGKPGVGDIKANANIIRRTLGDFGIQVEMDEVSVGPSVTRYALKPAQGVKLSKIEALHKDLSLALAAHPIRIEAPIPGKSLVGIEIPNTTKTMVGLGSLLRASEFQERQEPLLFALGKDVTGNACFADLGRAPHMLVAGATGSGKSVTIHAVITSFLYRNGPDDLKFIMIDPKRVELTQYNGIPHLLTPVITDPKKAILALKWLAKEMERRYNILEAERVRDIASYHTNVLAPALEKAAAGSEEPLPEAMPYIVLIIDELADIMSAYPRELESGIVRLAQMSRAIGIHLILSTQRPSVKVITGLIKANIPARVALQVASQIDSRTILDTGGAEKLLGAGDMLFLSGEMSKPRRIQAPFITETEVKRVVAWIAKQNEGTLPMEIDFTDNSKQNGGTDAIFASMESEGDDDDELYPEAKKTVIEAGKASTSYLQRKLGVGYARAAKLIDMLEDRGVVGPADGAKPRDIIGEGNADELAQEPEDETGAESEEDNARR